MLRLIVLLCLSVLVASSVEARSSLLATTEPPFRQVMVERETVAPGQEQSLAVALDQPGGLTTIFRLAITYPSGAKQDVLDETVSNEATISWLAPLDAGAGVAQYTLTTSGCGCGDRSRPASPVNIESTAKGVFFVRP